MELSPEERRKVYEEEKARIEAEENQNSNNATNTSQLPDNVAGLLCYAGMWITGIIFIILERNSRFVRFHAMQSIVLFATLMLMSAVFGWLPFVGVFFRAVFGITAFIFWIVLMVKSYQGELYKVPVAGELAEIILDSPDKTSGPGQNTTCAPESAKGQEPGTAQSVNEDSTCISSEGSQQHDYSKGRTGRIVGYSAAITWNIFLLVFLAFFHDYIAVYNTQADGSIIRTPILTADYSLWLPIVISVIIVSITIYAFLIRFDMYWFRQTCQALLNILGVAAIASLVFIFPFDFSVIPHDTVASYMPVVLTIVLIMAAVGFAIGTVVSIVKLFVYLLRL